jgi:hypothetical protein
VSWGAVSIASSLDVAHEREDAGREGAELAEALALADLLGPERAQRLAELLAVLDEDVAVYANQGRRACAAFPLSGSAPTQDSPRRTAVKAWSRLARLFVLPAAAELMLDHRLGIPGGLGAKETDARTEASDRQDDDLADAERAWEATEHHCQSDAWSKQPLEADGPAERAQTHDAGP